MIMDKVLTLKSSRVLLDSIRDASKKKLSPRDIQEQRVSFVYGSMGNQNSVTKERIREFVCEFEGVPKVD